MVAVSPTPVSPFPEPWPGATVEVVPGHQMFVRRAAGPREAPTAMLVHGLGGSSLNWTDVMGPLSQVADVWAPDLPGYGESAPDPTRDHGVRSHVRAVERLIERVARDRPVHLVGNSMGGLVALRLAAARPDLVRTLALVSPALPPRRVTRDAGLLTLLATPRLGERFLERNRSTPVERQTRALLSVMFADPSVVPAERFAAAVEERRRRNAQPWSTEVFLGSLRSLLAEGLRTRDGVWRAAAGLRAPTLVLYGQRDRLVHHGAAARWAKVLPSARVVLLPATGHVAQIERPEVVGRLLEEHWAQ